MTGTLGRADVSGNTVVSMIYIHKFVSGVWAGYPAWVNGFRPVRQLVCRCTCINTDSMCTCITRLCSSCVEIIYSTRIRLAVFS